MDFLLKGIPQTLDYDRLESYISSYAKTFTLKALASQQPAQSSWNATLSIPHKISALMILELLGNEKNGNGNISIKVLPVGEPSSAVRV